MRIIAGIPVDRSLFLPVVCLLLSLVSNPPASGSTISVTYTTDAEFNSGTLNGVVTAVDQLELSANGTTYEFAWIANSDDGSISKVSTITGDEVARYYTGPPSTGGFYGGHQPSRTAIDADGNCWVANRYGTVGFASVTMILTEGGEDRNANSNIETSQDTDSSGIIDPWEMYPWGDDERVVRHYRVGAVGDVARALVIDKSGFLWVGMFGTERVIKVDPTLSTATYGPDMPPTAPPELASIDVSSLGIKPYGLALSPSGMLYTLSHLYIAELDPGLASGGTGAGPIMTQHVFHDSTGNYGIVVDQNCIVWAAVNQSVLGFGAIRWDPTVGFGDPLAGWTFTTTGAAGPGRGITVDFDGDIWMVCNDSLASLSRFDGTGNWLANYPTGLTTPVGAGVSQDGNIVVVDAGGTDSWAKINQTTGAVIPLAGPQLVGDQPYTYSDFTGNVYNIVGYQQGFWNVITDGGVSGVEWISIGWNDSTPPLTSTLVEARAANDLGTLAGLAWEVITTPGALSPTIPGRYIETRVRLERELDCSDPVVTPILYDLTVEAICDTCTFECPPDTVVDCVAQGGAVVNYLTPRMSAGCDPSFVVECTPASGSLFPAGSNVVTCIAYNAIGDTLTCHFEVFVNDCGTTSTGPCCDGTDCYITTEIECIHDGGIYLGDGGDCEDGCPQDCISPPRGMTAWWPLDNETGGVTPNLAAPGVGGVVTGPTPLPGSYVENAYTFDGVDDVIVAPDDPSIDLGTSDFSIDCWIRTSTASGFVPIVDKRNQQGGPVRGYFFHLNDGYPALDIFDSGGSAGWALNAGDGGAAAFVADNNWHQVAVTVDRSVGNGVRFYVDGIAVGSPKSPLGVPGSLDNAVDLWMGRNQLVTAQYANASVDEVEIFRRVLTSTDINDLFVAGDAGKCREACYATTRATCCNWFLTNSTVTICNYDDVSHLYSWGLSPATGPGCTGTGATSFSPPSGSVTVGPGDCVNIPVNILCPTGTPVGTEACYTVTVFNHDTGVFFDCLGSVRRPGWWCHKWISVAQEVKGIHSLVPTLTHSVQIAVQHIGSLPVSATMDYEIKAFTADGVTPSDAISLDGRTPGASVVGSLNVPPNGADISLNISYPAHQPLAFDRIVLFTDDTMDGTPEPVSEIAVRSDAGLTSGVPVGGPIDDGGLNQRTFLSLPNPFSVSTTVQFRVKGQGPVPVTLQAFDVSGRQVRIFHDRTVLEPGVHEVLWDGQDSRGRTLSAGVYFLRLSTPSGVETVRALVLR